MSGLVQIGYSDPRDVFRVTDQLHFQIARDFGQITQSRIIRIRQRQDDITASAGSFLLSDVVITAIRRIKAPRNKIVRWVWFGRWIPTASAQMARRLCLDASA